MERNRLGSTRDEATRASLEAVIEFLESRVEDLNAQMADRPARRAGPLGAVLLKRPSPEGAVVGPRQTCRSVQELESVRSNQELKSLDTLLQSVPGVGPIVSATLLSGQLRFLGVYPRVWRLASP